MHKAIRKYTAQLTLILSMWLAGCSSIVQEDTPTIAHVHIGHSLTGWVDTPNNLGLLVTAEQEATIAAANADLLIENSSKGDLDSSIRFLKNIGHVLDPEKYPEGNGKGYGLRKAVNGAISHLKFASDSADASNNVLRSIALTTIRATSALDKCDELITLVDEMIKIGDIEIIAELAKDIRKLAYDIAGGSIKVTDDAYGLFELRSDIEDMVAREDPPYSTVKSFYLFNLIRLPDGSWEFAKGRRRSSSSSY